MEITLTPEEAADLTWALDEIVGRFPGDVVNVHTQVRLAADRAGLVPGDGPERGSWVPIEDE